MGEVDAATIRREIRERRLRDHYFRGSLFADPAWDMLLELMAARLENEKVAVSSLCIAAAVPATTALRWIKALIDQDLFIRVADPQDGRRVFIELSQEAATAMTAYFSARSGIAREGVARTGRG
jgi:DNA-binding MarR family transcriptional regulator